MVKINRNIKNHILFVKLSPLIAVVILFIACHRTIPGIQSLQPSDMQSEIERFEQAKGISCSDIPVIYDITPLKVGSMVKWKSVNYRIPDKSFISSTILNDIEVTSDGEWYQIKIDAESAILTNYQNKLSSKIVCIDESAAEPKRNMQLKDDMLAELRKQNVIDSVISGVSVAPILGPIAAGLAVAEGMRGDNRAKEVYEKSLEMRQEIEAKTEKETKLIDFKLVSEELLIVSGSPVPCKVYLIDLMTMTKSPSYSKGVFNIPASTSIIYESKKLWVSDDIPFGIAKHETKHSTITQTNSQIIKVDESIISEVVEFKY